MKEQTIDVLDLVGEVGRVESASVRRIEADAFALRNVGRGEISQVQYQQQQK